MDEQDDCESLFDDLQASITEFEAVLRSKFPVDAGVSFPYPKGGAAELWFRRPESGDRKRVLQVKYDDGSLKNLTKGSMGERIEASKHLDDLVLALREAAVSKISELQGAARVSREMSLKLVDNE